MGGWLGSFLHGDPGNGDDLGSDFGQLTKSLGQDGFFLCYKFRS